MPKVFHHDIDPSKWTLVVPCSDASCREPAGVRQFPKAAACSECGGNGAVAMTFDSAEALKQRAQTL